MSTNFKHSRFSFKVYPDGVSAFWKLTKSEQQRWLKLERNMRWEEASTIHELTVQEIRGILSEDERLTRKYHPES